jgi:hypothetical protein
MGYQNETIMSHISRVSGHFLAGLWGLEETAAHGNQLERNIFAHSSIVTMAMGNKLSHYVVMCPKCKKIG